MQGKDKISNYFLTLGFVLLIITVIVATMFVSRFALQDVSPLGEHVIGTKNLLQDVTEVKKTALDQSNATTVEKKPILGPNVNIIDISKYNANPQKGFVTLVINGTILESQGKYYVQLKALDQIQKGENIVYSHLNSTYIGSVLTLNEDGSITIKNQENNQIDKITRVDINGYYLLSYTKHD